MTIGVVANDDAIQSASSGDITAVVPHLAEGYTREGNGFRHHDYFDRSLEIGAGGVHTTVQDLLRWEGVIHR